MLEIPISEAKARLTALVRQAEQGQDVVLTRNGKSVARITSSPAKRKLSLSERMQVIREIQASAKAKLPEGVDSARSQDFLYGDDGLPG